MSRLVDLVGKQFGRLLPFQYAGKSKWWVICTHNLEDSSQWSLVVYPISTCDLNNKHTQSCGCLHKQGLINKNKTSQISINKARFEILHQNEIGKVYAGGTIVDVWTVGDKNKTKTRVLVECSKDGSFYECSLNVLKRGQQSCGCLNIFEIGEASLNDYYKNYMEGARIRKKNFDLTKEQFRELVIQNCFYSGTEPRKIYYDKTCNGAFFGNGLDRPDNSLGYSLDNTVPCCTICNSLKFNLSVEDWEAKLKRICQMDYQNLFFDYHFENVSEDLLKLQRYNFKVQKSRTKNKINILTEQEFYHLATSDCFYCGMKPSNLDKRNSKAPYQGIDQVVHDGGYIYSNCVPCCRSCNTAKSNHPQEFFIQHLIKLQKFQRTLRGMNI